MFVYLPDLPDGSKQGVDDYLGAGGTVWQLKHWYATSELRPPEDAAKAQRHPTLLSVHDVLSKPEPKWTVEGWLVAGTLAVLYAPSSRYKSFIALDIALSVALGRPWQG
jgi:RecA-family ATPase